MYFKSTQYFGITSALDFGEGSMTVFCGNACSSFTYCAPDILPTEYCSLLITIGGLLCRSLPRRLERTPRVPATQFELSVQSLGKVPGTAIFVTARPFKIVC
ncbi:hypothetical protein PMIN03_012946 [Paraphaeosphaeria minitans]